METPAAALLPAVQEGCMPAGHGVRGHRAHLAREPSAHRMDRAASVRLARVHRTSKAGLADSVGRARHAVMCGGRSPGRGQQRRQPRAPRPPGRRRSPFRTTATTATTTTVRRRGTRTRRPCSGTRPGERCGQGRFGVSGRDRLTADRRAWDATTAVPRMRRRPRPRRASLPTQAGAYPCASEQRCPHDAMLTTLAGLGSWGRLPQVCLEHVVRGRPARCIDLIEYEQSAHERRTRAC